jgi:hypothetical protein
VTQNTLMMVDDVAKLSTREGWEDVLLGGRDVGKK